MWRNAPKETASDENILLLQANLGMFGTREAENTKVGQLKRIDKQLKNAKKGPNNEF